MANFQLKKKLKAAGFDAEDVDGFVARTKEMGGKPKEAAIDFLAELDDSYDELVNDIRGRMNEMLEESAGE